MKLGRPVLDLDEVAVRIMGEAAPSAPRRGLRRRQELDSALGQLLERVAAILDGEDEDDATRLRDEVLRGLVLGRRALREEVEEAGVDAKERDLRLFLQHFEAKLVAI